MGRWENSYHVGQSRNNSPERHLIAGVNRSAIDGPRLCIMHTCICEDVYVYARVFDTSAFLIRAENDSSANNDVTVDMYERQFLLNIRSHIATSIVTDFSHPLTVVLISPPSSFLLIQRHGFNTRGALFPMHRYHPCYGY